MEEEKTEAPRECITLVCCGKTYLTDGKIGLVFREIVDGELGAERIYRFKSLEHVRVGAVYEVENLLRPDKRSSISRTTGNIPTTASFTLPRPAQPMCATWPT